MVASMNDQTSMTGSLKQVSLVGAKLRDVKLSEVNFEDAELFSCDLEGLISIKRASIERISVGLICNALP